MKIILETVYNWEYFHHQYHIQFVLCNDTPYGSWMFTTHGSDGLYKNNRLWRTIIDSITQEMITVPRNLLISDDDISPRNLLISDDDSSP